MRLLALLAVPGLSLAHPGHGAPEVHAHLADAALIGLGIFAFAMFVVLLRRLARK